MTFATKIQSLKGTHVPSGTTNAQCAVDWGRRRVFIGDSTNLARVGIRTGTEQTYALASGYAEGGFPPIGLDSDGNLYQSIAVSLTAGGIQGINGDTLAKTLRASYSAPNFGGSNTVAVKTGSQQFAISTNIGNTIINLNNTSVSKGKYGLVSTGWPNGNARSAICSGKPGSNLAFLLTSPGGSASTQIATLHKIVCGVTAAVSVVETYAPSDLDAAWTEIYVTAICADQTDGNLLAIFGGQTAATTKLVKLDRRDGSIIWATVIPDSAFSIGPQLSQSRIRNQRIGIITSSPSKVTIIDTADGSIETSFTTGLAGLTIHNYQCYDDTLGAIIGVFSMVPASGGPTLLRNTPGTYAGWFVLYVADAITPSIPDIIPGFDEVDPYEPPIIIPPVRQLDLFPQPPFKAYRCGADGVSVFPVPFRIIEQTDLRVEVDGVELTQSDFTYTAADFISGLGAIVPGHNTGHIELVDAASDCIVRIWCDRAPSRTDDIADGEFDKAAANSDLETLWVIDRAQHLLQTRRTDDPETGAVALPAAYAGKRIWLQGDCAATRAGTDTIYDGHSSGTVLTGTGTNSLAELVCVKKDLWFVRTKSGSWSVA
jgi:hypothetical protein